MITALPRLKDTKAATAEILPRLASDRRKKIPQVGKVFPKSLVHEKVDEKLDFHCVSLEKDKNVSFPSVEIEDLPSSLEAEIGALSPSQEPGDGTEVTLPELPSILGSRRSGTTPGADVSEPLDLLIKGEAHKKSQTDVCLDEIEEPPVIPAEEVMRANLVPLIDTLFEEDELFAQDFDQDGLNRVLFIRKMGIYVEIKTKDYLPGVVCTPLFHCPRCKDHWTEFGTVPEDCQFPRQPTRGPMIQLASNRKPRFGARKRKTKRRLGDIKEGFIVSGSGTVLNQIDENDYEDTSPQSYSNRARVHSTLGSISSRDYLTSDDVNLEDVNLREIDSHTMMEAFKEVADAQKLDGETYVRTVAEALGFNEDQYNDFARVNNNKTVNKSGEESNGDLTTAVQTAAEQQGNDVSRVDIIKTAVNESGEENYGDLTTAIQTAAAQQSNDAFRVDIFKTAVNNSGAESFGDFRTAAMQAGTTTGLNRKSSVSQNGKSSVRSILNLSMLNSMTVKDLPERIRAKLLSLLRLQRKRIQKALSNNKTVMDIVDRDAENSESCKGSMSTELCSEDTVNGRSGSSVKTSRKRRDSQVKHGRLQRQSMDGIDDAEETPETMVGSGEGGSRVTSASGWRYSRISAVDSDEEGFSTSRSPSDVLAYKEIQSQRRSRKKNRSVKNRSGQPDTPHQRLGRHNFTVPSNSSSFYSHDDGDSDEENWARGRAPRVGSSRAHVSDSRTSYMSDMARAPHVTDSRASMLRKHNRAMGSARARKDVSFSNLDDQMSYSSLGNDDSYYDLYDEATGTRSNRARRTIRKKEKGDGVKRPGNYHSKVIQDMALGQGSPSVSHVTTSMSHVTTSMSHATASFGDANIMYGVNARPSQARISLTEASSALSCDSTVMNKRSVRPVSGVTVKEHAQKRKGTPEPEPTKQNRDVSTPVENSPGGIDVLPPLEAAIPEDSGSTPPAQVQEKQQSTPDEKPEKLFKRVEKKPLVLLEDLNVIHRLPVSSAFTYSFYELPSHHRQHNESIKKAASRIGRRKKKESGHFRSKSAP